MALTKITEKETTALVKDDLHLLITQTEKVKGADATALRRMAAKTFLEGCGVNVLTDARDNEAYGMAWGIDASGHPTLTLTEKEDVTV